MLALILEEAWKIGPGDWSYLSEVVRAAAEPGIRADERREIVEWLRRVTRELPAGAPADYNCVAALIIDGEHHKGIK
jgi:hypothetical protein